MLEFSVGTDAEAQQQAQWLISTSTMIPTYCTIVYLACSPVTTHARHTTSAGRFRRIS